jgi:glutamate racemase
VQLVDTALAVTNQTERLLTPFRMNADVADVDAWLETTGDATRLNELAAAWLPFSCRVDTVHHAL